MVQQPLFGDERAFFHFFNFFYFSILFFFTLLRSTWKIFLHFQLKNHAQTSTKLNASFLFRNLFFYFLKIPLSKYCLRVKHFSKREIVIKVMTDTSLLCSSLFSFSFLWKCCKSRLAQWNQCLLWKKCCYSSNDIKECLFFSFLHLVYIGTK
jgi:hypothetical protein